MPRAAKLEQLYASQVPDADKRAGKAKLLAELTARIRNYDQQQGRSSGYTAWLDAGLNNAHLATVATYYELVPPLEKTLHETCGDYLPCLYVTAGKSRNPD